MNLPHLIKTGESDTIEFKEKFDDRTIESAVAFANTKGGIIFTGVSNKNNITGVKIGKETLNKWTNQKSPSDDLATQQIIDTIRYPMGSELNTGLNPQLSWSHYRALIRVKKDDVRLYYERYEGMSKNQQSIKINQMEAQ